MRSAAQAMLIIGLVGAVTAFSLLIRQLPGAGFTLCVALGGFVLGAFLYWMSRDRTDRR